MKLKKKKMTDFAARVRPSPVRCRCRFPPSKPMVAWFVTACGSEVSDNPTTWKGNITSHAVINELFFFCFFFWAWPGRHHFSPTRKGRVGWLHGWAKTASSGRAILVRLVPRPLTASCRHGPWPSPRFMILPGFGSSLPLGSSAPHGRRLGLGVHTPCSRRHSPSIVLKHVG